MIGSVFYKYDFIVATCSIHHLRDDQKILFLRELLEHLKDDGKILIGGAAFGTSEELNQCKEKIVTLIDCAVIILLASTICKK